MDNRAGYFKTNLSGDMEYKSFCPRPLPPDPPISLGGDVVELLVKANKQVALLDRLSSRIPNVNMFVSMYIRKEALMSSQIEGTQATLEDVLDPHADVNANRNVADVINYIKATEFAVNRLQELPICNRLIREIHAVLMEGVRGQEKDPGEFRRSQNWIGGSGSTLKNARFIPPPVEDMQAAISDLEKYINAEDGLDLLVRAALVHYQFETIHPFLDGNGRVGRLLITLQLMQEKALSSPALYISYFLKKNRIEYYDRMSEVRRNGNFEQWVKFFLQAVYESAEDAVNAIDRLTALHERSEEKIRVKSKSAPILAKLLVLLEASPIIEIGKTAEALGISYNAALSAIKKFCELGILAQNSEGMRNRTFAYTEYINILSDGT
jgi:Fic family protein